MAKKAWDLTSTNSLTAAAEWLRKQSGALLVVVVRVEDSAIAVHADCSPNDAMDRLLLEAMDLTKELNRQRTEVRAGKGRKANGGS